MKKRIALTVAIGALVLTLVPVAFAGKGGGGGKPSGGGGSTLNLVVVSSPVNDGLPHYAGQVTFNVSTTATTQPSVKLNCYQGGVLVAYSSAGFYPSYPWPWAQTFTLASGDWTGGAADCTASLYYYNGKGYTTLKAISFHVQA